jgi:hypothetical protein
MDFYLTLPSNVHDDTVSVKKLTTELWQIKKDLKLKDQKLTDAQAGLEKARESVFTALEEEQKLHKQIKQLKDLRVAGNNSKELLTEDQLKKFNKAMSDLKTKKNKANLKTRKMDVSVTEKASLLDQCQTSQKDVSVDLENTNIRLTSAIASAKQNKTNDFRIQLPYPIQLTGPGWEVALVEIMYPRSWNNINESVVPLQHQLLSDSELPENCIQITMPTRYATSSTTNYHFKTHTLTVPGGYYDTVDKLVEALNKETELLIITDGTDKTNVETTKWLRKELPNWLQFSYNPIIQRISIWVSDKVKFVRISEHLKYMLGFDDKDVDEFLPGNKYLARFPTDLRGGTDSLYVYCDLVEPQIVGNVRVPLLRTVPVTGSYGQVIDEIFHSPHYMSLQQTSFSSIHLTINSDTNEPLRFQFGKSVIKLHFRKRRPQYGG